MDKTSELIQKILRAPVTDHVVISRSRAATHHVRFSNNAVNRENLFKLEDEARVEVGFEGRTGAVQTNDLSEDGLKRAVGKALETARLLPKDPEYMPPLSPEEARLEAKSPAFSVPGEERAYAVVGEALEAMKKAGLNSAGSFGASPYTLEVHNNRGLFQSHSDCACFLALTAMTKNSSYKDTFYSRDFSDYDGKAFLGAVTERARLSENPAPLEAGKYTVVLSPAAVEELLLSHLWYNMDAKAIDEGRSAFSKRLGAVFASDKVRIFTEPGYGRVGLAPFSAEDGLPARAFDMISGGKLVSPWYSRYYAAKKGVPPTGRQPCNIIFKGTDRTAEQLIAGVEDGLYVNSFWYIRLVDLMDGVFTGMTRDGLFRIKNGRLAGSVNNFRFNQSVFDLLRDVAEVGEEKGAVFSSMPYLTVKDFNFVSKTEF